MKQIPIIMTIILALVSGSCVQQSVTDTEKEKQAVRAVIEEEMAAFYDQDLDRIAATWVDDETARKVVIKGMEVSETRGINAILADNRAALAREMVDSTRWESGYLNYDIRIHGNSALVFHESRHRSITPQGTTENRFRRIVHLVKKEGQWKMDMMALYLLPQVD